MKNQEIKISVPIPESMMLKSVKSEVKDGVVVIVPEYVEEPKYKDGDILALDSGAIIIYNSDNSKLLLMEANNYYAGLTLMLHIKNEEKEPASFCGYRHDIRGFATAEEKQKLFDVLAKNGYKWNSEEKKLDKVLPRAEKNDTYYYVNNIIKAMSTSDDRISADDNLYNAGNYFLTKEEAEKYAAKFKEMLENRTL